MKTYKLSGHGMTRLKSMLDAIENGKFKVELVFWDGKPSLFEIKVCDSLICIWDLNPSTLLDNARKKIMLAFEHPITKEERCYFANNDAFDNSVCLHAKDVMEVEQ